MNTTQAMQNLMIESANRLVCQSLTQANLSKDTIDNVMHPVNELLTGVISDAISRNTGLPKIDNADPAAAKDTNDELQRAIIAYFKKLMGDMLDKKDEDINQIAINALCVVFAIKNKANDIINIMRSQLQKAKLAEATINTILDSFKNFVKKMTDKDFYLKQRENNNMNELMAVFFNSMINQYFGDSENAKKLADHTMSRVFESKPGVENDRSKNNDGYFASLPDGQQKSIKDSLLVLGIFILGFVLDLLSPLIGKITLKDVGIGVAKHVASSAASSAGTFFAENIWSPAKTFFGKIGAFFTSFFNSNSAPAENAKPAPAADVRSTRDMADAFDRANQERAASAKRNDAASNPVPTAAASNSAPGLFTRVANTISSFFSTQPAVVPVKVEQEQAREVNHLRRNSI